MPIRIHLTVIDKTSWLFVQVNKKLEDTRIVLQSATGRKLHDQPTGILLPGQMFSFVVDADDLDEGTYLVLLFDGQEMMYKKRVMLQQTARS